MLKTHGKCFFPTRITQQKKNTAAQKARCVMDSSTKGPLRTQTREMIRSRLRDSGVISLAASARCRLSAAVAAGLPATLNHCVYESKQQSVTRCENPQRRARSIQPVNAGVLGFSNGRWDRLHEEVLSMKRKQRILGGAHKQLYSRADNKVRMLWTRELPVVS